MGMPPSADEQMRDARYESIVADPSALTTSAILREISNLEKLLSARIDAVEKAVDTAHENLVRVPTEVDKAIGQLKMVVDERGNALNERFGTVSERFVSIQTQFSERDTRTDQTSRDSKVAVDAALQAAKEAVGEQNRSSALAISKSEVATMKQIDQMGTLIASNVAGIATSINDLKERLTRLEGSNLGSRATETAHNTATSTQIAIAGVLIALVVGGSTLLARRDPPVAVVVPSQVSENTARLDALTRQMIDQQHLTPPSK